MKKVIIKNNFRNKKILKENLIVSEGNVARGKRGLGFKPRFCGRFKNGKFEHIEIYCSKEAIKILESHNIIVKTNS